MIFITHHQSPCYNPPGRNQAGSRLILHQPDSQQPPALIQRQFSVIWWTGQGMYYRQQDNLWVKSTSLLAGQGKWQDVAYFTSMTMAATNVVGIVDIGDIIRRAVYTLGLTPADKFVEITRDQCLALQQIAEDWHLMYCWSENYQKRHFQKPLIHYTFNWSFEG